MKIKGFNKDLKCKSYQFEVGKEYKIENGDKPLKLCTDTVFHYCNSLIEVHEYYDCNDKNNRYCEIEVLGEEVSDGEKCGSNHIRIVREIIGEELGALKGWTNGNTGVFNTGHYNAGDHNTGNRNTGDHNTGYYNTGSCNTGDHNTGYYNTGNRNTGGFNICDYSSGFFCTQEPKAIIFDQSTDMTVSEFGNSKWYKALCSAPFRLTEWVECAKEEADEAIKVTGGYLKEYTYEEACANWWKRLSPENREIIKTIPNFSAEKFKKITGIDVEECSGTECEGERTIQ